jgi:hypothetical protein
VFGIPYMADVYYPSDLLAQYKDIRLLCGGRTVSVSVNRYRNAKNGGTVDAEDVKNGLISVTSGQVMPPCGGAVRYVEVFTGKGSPGAIGTALEWLYHYREPFVKKFGAEGGRWMKVPAKTPGEKPSMRESGAYQCAKLMERHTRDPAAMMNAICDKFIGLDCSGFVGNFTRMFTSKYGPNTPISDFLRGGQRRQGVDDVQPMDILVWLNPDHIAVVDGSMYLPSVGPVFSVAQSTGPGPIVTIFRLKHGRDGRFAYVAIPGISKDGAGGRPAQIVTLGLGD